MKKIFLAILLVLLSAGAGNCALQGAQIIPDTISPIFRGDNESSKTLDGTTGKICLVLPISKTGTITGIQFLTGGVTTGDTIKASLQDIDASGYPDGTADQSGTVSVASTDDYVWKIVTFGSSRSVAAGDYISVVLEFNSRVSGVMDLANSSPPSGNMPNAMIYSGTYTASWAYSGRPQKVLLDYNGTYPIQETHPIAGMDCQIFGNDHTPDEYANKVTYAYKAKMIGVCIQGRTQGSADLVLYNSASSALDTAAMPYNAVTTGSTNLFCNYFPDGGVEISAGTTYYLSFKPTTTTDARINFVLVNNASYKTALLGSNTAVYASRTDAGAWTETSTRILMIFPVWGQLDDGAGGGSSVVQINEED
jgi:hypothetical protein